MTVVGTVVGAGFVSGKEISTFMNVYGNFAYIVAVLIGIIYYFCIKLFYNSHDFENPKSRKILEYTILVTQFISLAAMLAGLNAALSSFFNNNSVFYIAAVLLFCIILLGLDGLTNTNLILLPVVIIFVVYIGSNSVFKSSTLDIEIISNSPVKILTFLFMYMGLDLFGCYPICKTIAKKQTKKQQTLSAVIISTTISILILCYLVSVLRRGTNYAYFDLPILHYVYINNDNLYVFACTIVCIGIITTLLSNGFILHEYTKKLFHKNSFIIFLLLFCLAYLLSFIGFSKIIEYLYPIIGIVGITLVSILVVKHIKGNKKAINHLG